MQQVVAARGYERALDLTEAEASGKHLEGTGAFVLDRINGVAYVARSERADTALAQKWVEFMGYKVRNPASAPSLAVCSGRAVHRGAGVMACLHLWASAYADGPAAAAGPAPWRSCCRRQVTAPVSCGCACRSW